METTIVHLSDLHFRNDVENRFRVEKLLKDLERLPSSGQVLSVLTGDLIQAGDDNDYDLLFDELIAPLIELNHEIAVVPGNHDVQRSVATADFTDKMLADRGSSYLFNGASNVGNPHAEPDRDPLRHYSSFEDLFAPYASRSYWGYLRQLGSVSLIGLNSTWLSRSRDDGDSDRGKLRVEPGVLDALTKSLPENTLKVALLHHPLDWLEENTRDAVAKLITSRIDMALFGHVHTGDVSNLSHGEAGCVFVQSPPLRAGWSKGTNGYGIIRCNVEHKRFEIEYRSYSQPRREFVQGEDFAEAGAFYPRPEDRQFFNSNPSDIALEQKVIDGGPFDFNDWYRNNIRSKTKWTGTFIVPKVRRVHQDQEDQWLEPPERICEVVVRSNRDQFFVAPLDAGSTTAAFLVFKQLAETFASHKRVPAFFDADNEKINRATILRAINRSALVNYSHEETTKLAESGSVVLIVDGLSLVDAEHFNLFRKTVEKFFPAIRLVCFVSTEKRGFNPSDDSSLELHLDDDEVFEFAQLDVADIRTMVSLRRPELESDTLDASVTHVVDSFKQMDEPIYASSVAVVVETLSQDPDFKPLNKSRLLERYVECLLGRFELEDVTEGTFASSDKIDLLGHIARNLLESGELGLSESELKATLENYQKKYLIELPQGLIDEVLEKGILTLHGGMFTFRADYLFSFFVARNMKADAEFAESVLADDGIFRHYREVVFYGELEGTDTRSVLNHVYVEIGTIEEEILESYSRDGFDLSSEWSATCDDFDDENSADAALVDVTERLDKTEPSTEHADRVSDSHLAQVSRRRGIAPRVAIKEAEAKLLIAMRLYALLIKNALQLPGEEKLRHLIKLFEAGELWVGFLCARRDEIATRPFVLAGGIRFINFGAAIDQDKSVRDFKFNAPSSLSRILAEALRNPQLAVALRQVLPKLSPMGSLFARDALLEMPGKTNMESYTGSLLDESDINLATCSLRTLRSRFLASGRSKEIRNHIESILATLDSAKSSTIGLNFTRLRKARLVRDLRENARAKQGLASKPSSAT